MNTTRPTKPTKDHVDLLATHFDSSLGLQRRLRFPRTIVYSCLILTMLIAFWVTVAKVDRVVHMQGRVIPSGKQQLIQHLEGGIVSQVFVREGNEVRKGQSLIAISDLQANSSQGEKRARLEGLAARIARLQSEADGSRSFNINESATLKSPEMQQQKAAFEARNAKLSETLQILESQYLQKKQEATEQESKRKGLSSELEVARQQLAIVNTMISKNAASQLELLEAKGKVERLVTQINESESTLPRLQSAAVELKARAAEARAQFRSEARTALADSRVEQQRLLQEIGPDNDRVRRTVIVAPMSGVVNKILFNTVGGVVKPGETLMELTPVDQVMVVETRVSPTERGALQVGQLTMIKVGAFDYTVFGTVIGKITEISADSLVDERGDRYFRVSVNISPASLKSFSKAITPGMSVTADAVTGNRTVLQFLLSPIKALASTAFRDQK